MLRWHAGLPPPEPRPTVPHIITFQRKSANRRIINEPEFIELLKTYGELRVVEYGSGSSLYEQLLTMHATGVFISVHTSNLANAPLLQPGSGVFEIIQVRDLVMKSSPTSCTPASVVSRVQGR